MTTLQKIIKYLAIAFAMFLIITIVSTILGVVYALSGVLGLKKNEEQLNNDMSMIELENSDVATLEIELAYTDLTIKTGDSLRAETSNSNINCKQKNQSLEIKEENYKLFSKNNKEELIIYVPEDLEFEKVEITTGAGKINIENLIAQKLSFELGAGETQIENLKVSKKCDIEGGVGKLSILSGTVNELKLDMGVGELNMNAALTGKNEIDSGIGSSKIKLQGQKENYKIEADKGIGSVKIDGKEIADDEKYGNGENLIEIDGGIGSIKIDFE